MAPFVPFLAENTYQNLVRSVDASAPISVHMANWPRADSAWQNKDLLFEIAVVQKVVGLARVAREHSGVRTRQPPARILVRAPNDSTDINVRGAATVALQSPDKSRTAVRRCGAPTPAVSRDFQQLY